MYCSLLKGTSLAETEQIISYLYFPFTLIFKFSSLVIDVSMEVLKFYKRSKYKTHIHFWYLIEAAIFFCVFLF